MSDSLKKREVSEALDTLALDAINAFEKALGGRKALADVLLLADGTPETELLVSLLKDPGFDTRPLTRICRDAGLTLKDLIKTFDVAILVKAHLKSKLLIADTLVPIVADVMLRAAPHEVPCEACQGTGSMTEVKKGPIPVGGSPTPSVVPCKPCKGSGVQMVMPDLDRQKLALELGQLLQKAGVNINTQVNTQVKVPAPYAPGHFDAFQQAIADLQSAKRGGVAAPAVVDAEASEVVDE